MTLNYTCLGKSDKIRNRRFKVLMLFLKGGTPAEIYINMNEQGINISKKIIYNDLSYLRITPLHDLPIDMVRDFGKSFYEIKITELERKLRRNESNPSVWLGIQKLIKEYKDSSLKLQGAVIQKIEHTGEIKTTNPGLERVIAEDPETREMIDELLTRLATQQSGRVRVPGK